MQNLSSLNFSTESLAGSIVRSFPSFFFFYENLFDLFPSLKLLSGNLLIHPLKAVRGDERKNTDKGFGSPEIKSGIICHQLVLWPYLQTLSFLSCKTRHLNSRIFQNFVHLEHFMIIYYSNKTPLVETRVICHSVYIIVSFYSYFGSF